MYEMFDQDFVTPDFQMGENPSANMYTSARSLAKLGAFMANKGTLSG